MVMVLSWINVGNVQRIFSLAVLRTRYHSILPAWYRAAAASVSKARGCSQEFWGKFFSYNLHQSINSLDIQQFCFTFEGYSKILSWRMKRTRMDRRWSWPVLRYYPDICRDALRDKGKKIILLVTSYGYGPESFGFTSTWNLLWRLRWTHWGCTQQQHFSHLVASVF